MIEKQFIHECDDPSDTLLVTVVVEPVKDDAERVRGTIVDIYAERTGRDYELGNLLQRDRLAIEQMAQSLADDYADQAIEEYYEGLLEHRYEDMIKEP